MSHRTGRIALLLCLLASLTTSVFAANPVQLENAKLGDPDWMLYDGAPNGEIEGYASTPTVNRGEAITFFVSTVDPT